MESGKGAILGYKYEDGSIFCRNCSELEKVSGSHTLSETIRVQRGDSAGVSCEECGTELHSSNFSSEIHY